LATAIILISSASYAADLTNSLLDNASKKISEYASNLIPGEGHTEASIQLREGYSPDFSILGVREVAPVENGKIFTQFSLFNTEVANGKTGGDERYIGNLGFGVRKLSEDKTIMFGINNFWDYDIENEHIRTSLGLEARSAVFNVYYNRYEGMSDSYNEEQVLDGTEFQVATQIPHYHWMTAFINRYKWEGILRSDVKGKKYGSEMQLTPNLTFEVAYDNKDTVGVDDDWYSKLLFVHPGKEGPTALDGRSDTAWKETRDMSGELLSKVKRSNKIFVEFKGTSTISRTD